jgi:hypothetical protein
VTETLAPIDPEGFLAADFAAKGVDFVPDPMVMRIADLFISGRSSAKQWGLKPEEVWRAISNNSDSLFAFFHLLMTRDRIPLIDYGSTFMRSSFAKELGQLLVDIHPGGIYQTLKQRAEEQLEKTLDLSRIPAEMRAEIAERRKNEQQAVGYDWNPDAGQKFKDDKVLGSMLLGGLIFGGYAQMTGSDHVLQPSRQALLIEATQPEDAPLWGAKQEAKLFARLNAIVAKDPRLSSTSCELPPTVLPYLMKQKPTSSTDLLHKALALRDGDGDFKAYREWHRKLRAAWRMGAHSEAEEKAVIDVTQELSKRFPAGKDVFDAPRLWSREIGLKGTVGFKAVEAGLEAESPAGAKFKLGLGGGPKAELEADLGKVTLSFPNWIRNWLVEGLQFRSHRKVLLRMALAEQNFDYPLLGLKALWEAA